MCKLLKNSLANNSLLVYKNGMRHKCSRNGVLSFEALSLLLLIWHQVPVGALRSSGGAKSREEAPQRDKIIGEARKKVAAKRIEFAKKSKQEKCSQR